MGCCYDFSPLIIKNSFSKKNVSLKHLGTLLSKNIVEQFHYFLKNFYFKHFNSSCWKRMGDRYGFNPIIKNSSVKYKLNLRNDTPMVLIKLYGHYTVDLSVYQVHLSKSPCHCLCALPYNVCSLQGARECTTMSLCLVGVGVSNSGRGWKRLTHE